MVIAIKSFLYDVVQTVITVSVLLFMILLLPLPWRVTLNVVKIWARVLRTLSRWMVGIHVRVIGEENIPDGPVVVAVKHQSAWETAIFPLLLPNTVYVLKKELLSIPVWGWCARKVRSIAVDRAGGSGALKKMLGETKDRLREGRRVVIFPEGTRVLPGQSNTYHPGVAAIYRGANVPVIPVALNSGLTWGRRSIGMKYPGTITVQFLPPIAPGMDRKAFMDTLKSQIDTATEKLESEARASMPASH